MKKRTVLVDVVAKKDFIARTLLLQMINRAGQMVEDNEDDVFPELEAKHFQLPYIKTILDGLVKDRFVKTEDGVLVLKDKGTDIIAKIEEDFAKIQRVYGPFESVQLGYESLRDETFDSYFLLEAEDWDGYIKLETEYYENMMHPESTSEDLRFAVANFRGVDVLPIAIMLEYNFNKVNYFSSENVGVYLNGIDLICEEISKNVNEAIKWEEMCGVKLDDPQFLSLTDAQLLQAERVMTELISRGLKLSKDLEEHRKALLDEYNEQFGDGEEYDDDDEEEVVVTTTYYDNDYYYDYGYGVYYDPWVPLVWCAILW